LFIDILRLSGAILKITPDGAAAVAPSYIVACTVNPSDPAIGFPSLPQAMAWFSLSRQR
jgi:hypothetical protein